MFKMNIIAILFVLVQSIFCSSTYIDTIIVREIDVTNDNEPDSLILSLKAQNYKSHFLANLTVKSNGYIIYSYDTNDEDLEETFCEEFFPGYKTKEAMKMKYYFKDFLGLKLCNNFNAGKTDEYLFNPEYGGSIYVIAKNYIKENSNLSDIEIDKIIKRLVVGLKEKKIVIFSHKIKFYHFSQPMVYVPEIKKFVPIYSC